jgi:hypothetical protein
VAGGGGDTPTTTGTSAISAASGTLAIAGTLYKFKKMSLGALIVQQKTKKYPHKTKSHRTNVCQENIE